MTSKLVWETLIKIFNVEPLYTNYKSDIIKNEISDWYKGPKSKVVSVLHFSTLLEIIHKKIKIRSLKDKKNVIFKND